MTPTKALRLGMALAAEKGMDLALDVTKVSHTRLPHRALQATLDDQSLLAIWRGKTANRAPWRWTCRCSRGLWSIKRLAK